MYTYPYRVLIIISFVFSATLASLAQSKVIDSLEKVLTRKDLSDSVLISVRNSLTFKYALSDARKGIEFGKKTLALVANMDSSLIADSYNAIGIAYGIAGKQDSSILVLKKGLLFANSSAYLKDRIYNNLAIGAYYLSDYEASLDYSLKSLEMSEQRGTQKYTKYNSVANAYRRLNNHKLASHYDSLALEDAALFKASESEKYVLIGNAASSLFHLKKYKQAREMLIQVINYREKTDQKFYLATEYSIMCELGIVEGNYDEAYKYGIKSAEVNKEIGSKGDLARSYQLLGLVEFLRQQHRSARKFGEMSLAIADSVNLIDCQRDVNELLAKISLVQGRFNDFLIYDKAYVALKDTIALSEQAKAIGVIRTKLETEKKEKENQLLRERQLLQEANISNQRYIIVLIAVGLLAASVFILILYNNHLQSKKRNEILLFKNKAIEGQQVKIVEQNKIIEAKNTELQLKIQDIQNMQSQLIQAEKMSSLGQMTAGVAHEINNPLNFISGGVEALSYSFKDIMDFIKNPSSIDPNKVAELETEVVGLFNSLHNGVNRANKIIGGLKAFSSPQEGEYQYVSISDVIEISFTLLNKKITDGNISIEKKYSPEASIVLGNPSQISQVIINIMDNAIYAMEKSDEKKMTVTTYPVEDRVAIEIRDTGFGIPDDIQSKIMDPFFTTKPVGKGTGLGLSVSYGIIENHKGKIFFTSKVGQGTAFTIILPGKYSEVVLV